MEHHQLLAGEWGMETSGSRHSGIQTRNISETAQPQDITNCYYLPI